MDCRTFRKHHLAYLDDTLPGELMRAAERHVVQCATCAAHDTTVRRSLLLARNMSPITPSADFESRLMARLDDVRCGRCDVPDDGVPRDDWTPSRAELLRSAFVTSFTGPRARRAAIAAGLLALTYAGGHAVGWGASAPAAVPTVAAAATAEPSAEPSVDALPILVPSPAALASPALVSSASTGIPVWPAALLADQAPAHMVEPQLMLASW